MEIRKGIGVSPGVVICPAVVLDAEALVIPKRSIQPEEIAVEGERFAHAVAATIVDRKKLRDEVTAKYGKELGAIFDFHMGLLKDPTLTNQVLLEIKNHLVTAEYAVSVVIRRYAGMFQQMTDSNFAERVKDVYDIEKTLLRQLVGKRYTDLAKLTQNIVIIAHDLLPSQTAALDKAHVRGFATDVGGRTSHTAIVARAMGIPAVVGLGNITTEISGGDIVIIDGTRGMVIVNPDPDRIAEHRLYEQQQIRLTSELAELTELPAETQDGHVVSMLANIELTEDVGDALSRGAQGVGLLRTEFLFLAQDREPSEQEQYESFVKACTKLNGKPLVVRTLDLGADKYMQDRAANPERNPFLGDRSIRMCLRDIPMFKRQLRAILRASSLGDVRIMFPMISTLMELRQAKMILNDVMEELEDEGIAFRRDLPVGIMIEVPSAALMADNFAREVNFMSIGTNDLIQYTLAVDRTNEKVAGLYCPAHPAVLSLIRETIRAANKHRIGVSVCGEMAGEPLYTLLLLGFGLTTFSMNGPDIPEVKKIIRSTTMDHARKVASRVMSFDSERQVMHYLRDETRKIIPEAF